MHPLFPSQMHKLTLLCRMLARTTLAKPATTCLKHCAANCSSAQQVIAQTSLQSVTHLEDPCMLKEQGMLKEQWLLSMRVATASVYLCFRQGLLQKSPLASDHGEPHLLLLPQAVAQAKA
jgi:hypothetical protein